MSSNENGVTYNRSLHCFLKEFSDVWVLLAGLGAQMGKLSSGVLFSIYPHQ